MKVIIELRGKKVLKKLTNDFDQPEKEMLIFIIEKFVSSVNSFVPMEYIIFPSSKSRNAREVKREMPETMNYIELKAHKSSNNKRMIFKVSVESLKNDHVNISDKYCFDRIKDSSRVIEDGWKFE